MAKIQFFGKRSEVVLTSFGEIEFDANGVAIVNQDVAQELTTSFDNCILIPEDHPEADVPVFPETPVADVKAEKPSDITIESETTDKAIEEPPTES